MNMKMIALITALAALLAFSTPALAAEHFRVERMVVAEAVIDREPTGVSDTFAVDRERIYAFIEARDIQEDTTVNIVWFHDNQEIAVVPLSLGQGPRWRTYSSITVGERSGDWRVELHDEPGNIKKSVDFRVE